MNKKSLRTLAEEAGMDYNALCQKVRGKRIFTEEDIFKICKSQNINPVDFFFDGLIQK